MSTPHDRAANARACGDERTASAGGTAYPMATVRYVLAGDALALLLATLAGLPQHACALSTFGAIEAAAGRLGAEMGLARCGFPQERAGPGADVLRISAVDERIDAEGQARRLRNSSPDDGSGDDEQFVDCGNPHPLADDRAGFMVTVSRAFGTLPGFPDATPTRPAA